jgi:hypothetical protein
MIKLCYQEYSTKVTFDAHKEFLSRQGQSLGYYIGKALLATINSQGLGIVEQMAAVKEAVPYEVALDVFDCVTDKGATKQILDDAMFRVDWMPTEREGDYAEPWTFALSKLATEYGAMYNGLAVKKK